MESITEKIHSLRTGQELPKNRNEYWSKEQDEQQMKFFEEDAGLTEMALDLGRTEVSIVFRLLSMGAFLPQSRPRSPNKNKDEKNGCRCPKCTRTDCENCGEDHLREGGTSRAEKSISKKSI